jgi:hypothetical protein
MFHDAQRRFREGKLYGHHGMDGYVRDLMKNYGNNGGKVPLPTRDDGAFQNALEFRRREKQHYEKLEADFSQLRSENERLHRQSVDFAAFINQYCSDPTVSSDDDAPVVGRDQRDSDAGVDRHGGRVLPAVQDDAAPRRNAQTEQLISNNSAVTATDGDASSADTAPRDARVPANETRVEEVGEPQLGADDAGRAADDTPAQPVDRQAGEHGAA